MSLAIIKPITITDAILTDSNVAETDYAQWAGSTTYALGARVIVLSTHKVYESLQNANTNHDPTSLANSAWWVEVGPTNRWKVFDTVNSTQTVQATSVYYELTPDTVVNAIGILNVDAAAINITITDPTAGEVYNQDFNLLGSIPEANWYSYFFADVDSSDQLVVSGIPAFKAAVIEVTITSGSTVSVGVIILGKESQFGSVVSSGARVGIQDYSRKETNDFGDTVLVQRAYAKRMDFSLLVDNPKLDAMYRYIADIRATPVIWKINGGGAIFGWYKDFEALISYPGHTNCNLSIEGLT